MCTFFTYKKDDFFVGRNMDIEYSFGERVVISPRKYPWKWKMQKKSLSSYAIIGMANITDKFPLYAEAVNEYGLCMASLNFPKSAKYFESKDNKVNLAPYELIPYILTKFKTVEEARSTVENINIIDIRFRDDMPLAPLHFVLADSKDCIVIEQDEQGLHIYDNDIGVLTNNPSFPAHRVNLENYMNLSPRNPKSCYSDKIVPNSYGQGMGAVGLPGDSSPMSRFVRTVYNKYVSLNSPSKRAVTEVFKILDQVSMIRGSVITESNLYDITSYSCCIDASKGIYYFKTYDNLKVYAIDMHRENLNSHILLDFPLLDETGISDLN